MTAEIAILNRSAVALAADSAVTVGDKVYNSAVKILSLSHKYPIGVMIYHSSTFMGVPWETIIKTYRNKLDDICFDYVEEYCDDFINYLRSGVVTADLQKNSLNSKMVHIYRSLLYNYENNEFRTEKVTMTEYINNVLQQFGEWTSSVNCSSDEIEMLLDENEDLLNEGIQVIFNGYQLSEADQLNLKRIIVVYIYSDDFSYEQYTGVVITGFGEEEMFPALYSYDIGSIHGNRLKIVHNKSVKIDGITTNSSIIPFAQQEVVYRYLLGFDPELQRFSRNRLTDLFGEYNQLVINRYSLEDDSFLVDLKNNAVEAFYEGIKEYQSESYINPMHEVLMNLPHNELGNFAETLVNLSSFKKKVSKELETVGGPIDVAVITKGDGLIWIKRKHYFDERINHQYFKR
ncbi:hypothetical protein [Paenibacillus sp. MMS18-CY102]|uniref:hypothetical protein n=1 Tax=Paenibacillus sp. MMS18-CY102 TaxID=2682849 RepID=UPI001365A1CC|nr:hypothetical protein [Paenibacillus sp. MMS18-CY102]MWC31021.1 hypothetical protein [Paenibacillus sp. MMS18-CY102]